MKLAVEYEPDKEDYLKEPAEHGTQWEHVVLDANELVSLRRPNTTRIFPHILVCVRKHSGSKAFKVKNYY